MGRRSSNYPPELRERAVGMVAEVRPAHPSDWAAVESVAQKTGYRLGADLAELDSEGAGRFR